MIRTALDRRTLLLAATGLVAVALLALSPRLFRDELGQAFAQLEDANAAWLWAAGAAFLAAVGCSASAWRAAVRLPGARTRARGTASGRS